MQRRDKEQHQEPVAQPLGLSGQERSEEQIGPQYSDEFETAFHYAVQQRSFAPLQACLDRLLAGSEGPSGNKESQG